MRGGVVSARATAASGDAATRAERGVASDVGVSFTGTLRMCQKAAVMMMTDNVAAIPIRRRSPVVGGNSVFDMAEAVHRMTGLSADVFGLVDRGFVREGAFADLVLFDEAAIIDRATFDDPLRMPTGINEVVVNGSVVARDGTHTGSLPGRALRRPST